MVIFILGQLVDLLSIGIPESEGALNSLAQVYVAVGCAIEPLHELTPPLRGQARG